jgi:hypothetical protein
MWIARLRSTITAMSTRTFIKRILGPVQAVDAHVPTVPLTLRYAVPADAEALDTLAQLDSARAPRGVVLVGEIGGEIWAAISIDDLHAIADPFRPTGELVALLLARARQVRRTERDRLGALPRVWPERGYENPALS